MTQSCGKCEYHRPNVWGSLGYCIVKRPLPTMYSNVILCLDTDGKNCPCFSPRPEKENKNHE